MEQKKKKQEDVLVVRDEKTGEISVVAGLDGKGYPKTTPAKPEHSQDFLRFDRHGDVIDNFFKNFYRQCKERFDRHGDLIDNFFKNFYRQCKEPTRFGFYRVAADAVDTILPVIKDLLKDPLANADMLAPHKVDTSKYQQQAETENVKQENNEPIKKTEEMEKTEELKQEKDVQQPQAAETQETTAQQKPEKPNLIADGDVDWEELRKCGIDKEQLSEKDMKALMNYGKTGLVDVTPTLGGVTYSLQARLSFQKTEDGKLKLTPHFIRNEPRLDIPHRGYTFTDEDKKALKRTGNLGKLINFANEKTGEIKPHFISIDRLTNEIVDIPADKVRIPNKIGQTNLSREEQDILRAGLPLPKEVTLSNGRKFQALLQVNADKRDVEFVPGQPRQQQSQRQGKSQDNPDAQGQKQENKSEGQRRNRSWTNEDGSIRPIKKWKDDVFTDQQIKDYVEGKTVVLANAKDDQGQPCTKYLKFDREKGRPLTYSQNPDLAQTVAPSNESRTQLAVNNEGKTNEVSVPRETGEPKGVKHVKEPLQQGQTAPKDDAQQKQQSKKSKGMKVS